MHLNEIVLQGMHKELQKLGAIPWNAIGAGVGSVGGAGALGGAALGAGIGAVKNYRQAKQQGATTGQAAAAGLMGAGGGALRGGALGGLAGAAGGATLGAFSPQTAQAVRSRLTNAAGPVGAFSRYGQRQVHSLTGWTPEGKSLREGMNEIRHGAYGAEKALNAARGELANPRRSFMDVLRGRTAQQGAQLRLDNATKGYEAAVRAENRGLTSIPGYAKALKQDVSAGGAGLLGREGALRTSAGSMGPITDPMTGLMMAMPAASAVIGVA